MVKSNDIKTLRRPRCVPETVQTLRGHELFIFTKSLEGGTPAVPILGTAGGPQSPMARAAKLDSEPERSGERVYSLYHECKPLLQERFQDKPGLRNVTPGRESVVPLGAR